MHLEEKIRELERELREAREECKQSMGVIVSLTKTLEAVTSSKDELAKKVDELTKVLEKQQIGSNLHIEEKLASALKQSEELQKEIDKIRSEGNAKSAEKVEETGVSRGAESIPFSNSKSSSSNSDETSGSIRDILMSALTSKVKEECSIFDVDSSFEPHTDSSNNLQDVVTSSASRANRVESIPSSDLKSTSKNSEERSGLLSGVNLSALASQVKEHCRIFDFGISFEPQSESSKNLQAFVTSSASSANAPPSQEKHTSSIFDFGNSIPPQAISSDNSQTVTSSAPSGNDKPSQEKRTGSIFDFSSPFQPQGVLSNNMQAAGTSTAPSANVLPRQQQEIFSNNIQAAVNSTATRANKKVAPIGRPDDSKFLVKPDIKLNKNLGVNETVMAKVMVITSKQENQAKSLEELRLEHYLSNGKYRKSFPQNYNSNSYDNLYNLAKNLKLHMDSKEQCQACRLCGFPLTIKPSTQGIRRHCSRCISVNIVGTLMDGHKWYLCIVCFTVKQGKPNFSQNCTVCKKPESIIDVSHLAALTVSTPFM